ncbi:MAG: hypothetical protein JO069_06270 [Verrucomicrobia bacterium]|nr:hypothetical protein [Verrucomicrobiota bacterium]
MKHPVTSTDERVETCSLMKALIDRRSRRFAAGAALEGGPLSYQSKRPPAPLTEDEEAALAFAACGVTGYALAELPYQNGAERESGGGNIMTHFIGRTAPSGDAMHDCAVFVINDTGAWMLKRPQDYPREEIPQLVRDAHERRLLDLYHKARVPIADRRLDVPREVPFVAPFNKWVANVPGTTYFLPVAELSALYINLLLSAFDDDFAFFIVDDHHGYQPAGVGRFARSAGGTLHDDPAHGRVVTISFMETWIREFIAIEQGAILQNLGLMAAALRLGGFPHFAAHPFIWPVALGFRVEQASFRRSIGMPPGGPGDMPVPTPVGLEHDGRVLIKPFCPPYYRNMEQAVLAFVDYKFAPGCGTFRDGGAATAWRNGAAVQAAVPSYSDRAIAATIAYCEYVYDRYGRFPVAGGPFHTVLAYQAHRLDPDFYCQHYRPDAAGVAG